jgi:hypothetical protein
VSVCSTALPSLRVTTSPALRSTVACWLAAAREMPHWPASSVVVRPSPMAASTAARVRPTRAPSAGPPSLGEAVMLNPSAPSVHGSTSQGGASGIGLSTTDRTDLDQGASILDGVIQSAAARYGDTFVDVNPYFAGHQICDSNSYLHSVNIFDIDESYHPTASGQADAYLPAFTTAAG